MDARVIPAEPMAERQSAIDWGAFLLTFDPNTGENLPGLMIVRFIPSFSGRLSTTDPHLYLEAARIGNVPALVDLATTEQKGKTGCFILHRHSEIFYYDFLGKRIDRIRNTVPVQQDRSHGRAKRIIPNL